MKDENCIFCKLANGDIPTRTIYEDEVFRVIMDASPAAEGHSLILPKDHYANIFELPEELAGEAMKLAKKLAPKMKAALKCDGLNILQNNGEAAGQTVFHFHMHLIPRYEKPGNESIIAWSHLEPTDERQDEIQKLLSEACK